MSGAWKICLLVDQHLLFNHQSSFRFLDQFDGNFGSSVKPPLSCLHVSSSSAEYTPIDSSPTLLLFNRACCCWSGRPHHAQILLVWRHCEHSFSDGIHRAT